MLSKFLSFVHLPVSSVEHVMSFYV